MSEKLKRTGWIHASVKPVRDGEYEIRFSEDGAIHRVEWRYGKWYFCDGGWKTEPFSEDRESLFGTDDRGFNVAPDECWRGLTASAYKKAAGGQS